MSAIGKAIRLALPEIALDVAFSVRTYYQRHGVFPNLFRPKNFNEKVVARGLFDRRPILRQFADKFAVRSFVADRIGEEALPELFCVTRNPKELPFSRLPSSFVVKPTHGSSWVRTVRDKNEIDQAELIRECEYWLSQDYYKTCRERVYKGIPRRILIEELIDDGSPDAPTDYKFLVFHGKVEVIMVIEGRFAGLRGYFLDRDWNKLDAGFVDEDSPSTRQQSEPIPKPPHLAEMIQAAEKLGRDMDFVRADFYDTPKKYYFGELTTTPAAGMEYFDPPEFNNFLGKLW